MIDLLSPCRLSSLLLFRYGIVVIVNTKQIASTRFSSIIPDLSDVLKTLLSAIFKNNQFKMECWVFWMAAGDDVGRL